MLTIEDARQYLRKDIKKGANCPCCGQLVKLYRRKIDGTIAKTLIWLVRSYAEDPRWYAHAELPASQHKNGGGTYGWLRFWNLTIKREKNDNPRQPKGYSGMWKPTQRGIEFASNMITIPKYVLVFNNKAHGFEGDEVTIQDCLPEYFDFWEAWGRV